MQTVSPLKTTDVDLEEYGKSHHLPPDYLQIIERGFHFFNYMNKKEPFTLVHELPTLNDPKYYQLIGDMNLNELNAPDYKFKDAIGFLNAVERYHYACIKSNSYHRMNGYFIVKIEGNGVQPHHVSRAFKRSVDR